MLTKSKSQQLVETCQENGENMSKSTEKTIQRNKGILQAKTRQESCSLRPKEVDIHLTKQNEVHLVSASETNITINSEEIQRQGFHSPIFNIHIQVPPSSESSSASPTIQPIIHVHFNERNKSHDAEGTSSQKSTSEKRVEDFSFMTSTDSKNTSIDLSDRSDSINGMNENNYMSQNENDMSQRSDSELDMFALPNISNGEISTEGSMGSVTETQVPVIKCSIENSKKAVTDKDFESVFPKLQLKLNNLIKKKLQQAHVNSYNEIKKKKNAKCKPLVQYHENNKTNLHQSCSPTSEQQIKRVLDESSGSEMVPRDRVQVMASDSDTSKGKSNKKEKVKGEKKLKKKSKSDRKSTRKCEDLYEYRTDGTRKYNSVKRNARLPKPERAKTRESIERKCKTPSKEHSNTVKKVASAKACESQPKVFAEKEMSVNSQAKSKKAEKSEGKSKTSLRSLRSNKKTQEDDSLLLCDTPKRFSRLSREVIDAESSPNPTDTEQASESQVLESGSESNGEICNLKKAEKLKSPVETPSASVNSDEETQRDDSRFHSTDDDSLDRWLVDSVNAQDLESRWEALVASGNNREETQQNDSVVSCETPKTISYGCQSEPSVLAEKEVLVKSPVNSKKAQDSKSTLGSVNNSEGTQQNDCTDSRETPERLTHDYQSQPTEEEVVEKSPVDERKAQELKNKWATAFASVNTPGKTQKNGSLALCETPKRVSSYQHLDKRSPKKTSDVECSPKAPNKIQPNTAQVSSSENERNQEICTSTPIPCREENLVSNHNKTLTLLAEGCNFSEILQKFREKLYKDKVKIFFPDTNRSNNENHVPQDSGCSAKESPLEDSEMGNHHPNGDINNEQTVKQKKEKDESVKCINGKEADENSNPSISLEQPVNCFSSPSEDPPQSTHSPVSPHERESFDKTNGVDIHVPVVSDSNQIHLVNEKNLNCDGENVPENKSIEKISDGIDGNESCCNSSLNSGNGTTPKNVILEEGNHFHVNEFRAIKKKLKLLPDNTLLIPDLEKSSDSQSSNTELKSPRKEVFNQCMNRYSSDIRQSEKTDSKLSTKRKGSPDPSSLDTSVKKMKQSKKRNLKSKTRKRSKKKVFSGDDYIPLDAAGPTKFAVAPLDKLTPYRKHAANDFKGNMLYGNRVKRFNDPKSLEIYKAKQNASKKSFQ